ncbi:MAG: carboxypeptidase regulatory-like domain-containing protein [Candidatus Falkowbacteria bacterium]
MKKTGMILVFNVLLVVLSVCIFLSVAFATTSYNFSSSADGFVARGAASVRHSTDGNGRLYMDTTGADPGMVKSLSIGASENNVFKIYVWTYCSEKTLQFYFKSSGTTTVYDGGSVVLSNADSGGEYVIDLSNNSNWAGTITEIRVDPSLNCGTTSSAGFIAFDYVVFGQKLGTVIGGVRNDLTDQALTGVTVYLRQDGVTKYSSTSNFSGNYTIVNVMPGSYELYCSISGYEQFGNQITVVSNSNSGNNVALQPNIGTVSGGVRNNSTNDPISGITVYLRQSGVTKYSAVSNSSGNFTFLNVLVETYELFCSLDGYNNFGSNITVIAGNNYSQNIAMNEVVSSTPVLVSPVVENTLPNISITSPQNGETVSSASVTITGTAHDSDVGDYVQFVQARVNGGAWQNATGTESWSANISLTSGSNTIEARAKDNKDEWGVIIFISLNFEEQVELKIIDLGYLNSFTEDELDYSQVFPNQTMIKIKATAEGGRDYLSDTLSITLKGDASNYREEVELQETGINTNIYIGEIAIDIDNSNNKNTVAVVQNNNWGDGNKLLSLSGKLSRGKASEYGFQDTFSGSSSYPACTPTAVRSAGFERVMAININSAETSNPTLFIAHQAKWFMYSGDGFSQTGSIDMGDCDYVNDLFRCSVNDVQEDDWSKVELIIFASCSVFNGDMDYGRAWFGKDGPKYFLGYMGDGPKTTVGNSGEYIIVDWYKFVNEGLTPVQAWIKANANANAWNASAYDKINKKYWRFESKYVILHKAFSYDLDVESDFHAAIGGGFYEPEGVTATVISSTQINLAWNYGINDPGVQWKYYILRSKTSSVEDSEFYTETNNTSYSDTGLSCGTAYYYWIGIHAGDYEPSFSDFVNATTTSSSGGGGGSSPLPDPEPERPQAPTNFRIM